MPNFKTHIITGILFYPVYFLLYSAIMNFFNIDFYQNDTLILTAFFFFVLGSDLPDVDHNMSLINRVFRILLIGAGIYSIFKIEKYYNFLSFLSINIYLIKTIYIIIGIILGWIFGILFNHITKHRGKWHSPFTGILTGIILYFLKTSNYYSVDYKTLFIALSLTTGFFIHLILDYYFKS
ncbi:hypothetical protein X275_07810 [Marinitoga sp. 1197]|uniref:metal-dependent hydrolase n=1 Tax=unclassified Marinitoga TaxID=2640159 RepID=UPI000640FA48|nr:MULTISPECIES: metal-dependent hydrolase [unclassified Marinitoga]KLO21836.1 hypothetical protein X275_07810 [Marinitoga sp. 1197]KLO22932.1 hypothetical protein X274_07275 [Marinitoga sp. 1155]